MLNVASSGKRNRIHPETDTGDELKVFRKRKTARNGHDSKNVYTIVTIEKKRKEIVSQPFSMEGQSRLFWRVELAKLNETSRTG